MPRAYDRAKMSVSSAPGTNVFTLASPLVGFQTFAAAGVPNGATVSYAADDSGGWEVGRGVYTAAGPTLSRGPMFSSNNNDLVAFSAQVAVAVTILAEDQIPTTYHDVDCRTTSPIVTLPASPADGEVHTVKDAYGTAQTHQPQITAGGTILIDGAPTFPSVGLWQNWASYSFRWNATIGKWFVQ